MKQRSSTLDLLRILAALWVMSFHWSGRGGFYPILRIKYDISWWPNWLNPISKTGLLGVDVFFILSGAVIAKSALNSNPKKFAQSRFLRLYPVYLLATAIAIVITPIAASGFNRSKDLLGLSGLQYWVGGSTIIGTSWTLPYEIGFYFLIFLSINYCKFKKLEFDEKQMFRFLTCWLTFLTITPALNFQPLTFLSIQGFGAYFVLGACLSQMKSVILIKKYSIIFAVSFVLSGKELISRVPITHYLLLFSTLLLSIVVLIIISSNFCDLSKYFSPLSHQLATLSLMTYPIYLLHETVGMSVISELNSHGISIKISYLLVFGFILFLSWLSVKYYEPFFKLIYKNYLCFSQDGN